MNYRVYVISAGRYNALPFNKKQKESYIFCVRNGEKTLYENAGCKYVHETGKLVESRNFALKHAFANNNICIQLSDDIVKVNTNKSFGTKKEVDLDESLTDMVNIFNKITGVYLMGVPPTDNYFYAKKLVSKNTFCIGDLLFVKPCNLYFDESLTLKEDYDYTLQHINQYGHCFRYQKYLYTFQHYKNKGGAVDYRNESEEQKNIFYLMAKWGSKIKLNPKRKNEILI
jgi:hypothetical protein